MKKTNSKKQPLSEKTKLISLVAKAEHAILARTPARFCEALEELQKRGFGRRIPVAKILDIPRDKILIDFGKPDGFCVYDGSKIYESDFATAKLYFEWVKRECIKYRLYGELIGPWRAWCLAHAVQTRAEHRAKDWEENLEIIYSTDLKKNEDPVATALAIFIADPNSMNSLLSETLENYLEEIKQEIDYFSH